MTYYNLQVHSAYDLLNSTIKYTELFSKLKKDGQDTVVITDPTLYGAIKAHKIAKKFDIDLVHGLEIKLGHGISFLKFNILCKNTQMFYRLLEISTMIENKVEWSIEKFVEELKKSKEDFVIIVIDELRDSMEFSYLNDVLKGFDFYFGFNEKFDASLYQYYENIVYTKPSFYLNNDQYQQVIVSRAIRDNAKLNITELTTTTGSNFVRTQEDFMNLLNIDNPLLKSMLEKALVKQAEIIDKCRYNLEFKGYHLPKYKYGKDEDVFQNFSSRDYLRYLVQKGAKEKLLGKDLYKYKKRYEYELKIIDEMGFNDYFLIVYDFVKYAKSNGILVGAGRGSAAGSLVCYLLNITEADPLEYNLLFERFLNKERISMPDIDIDFQDTRRDEVIKYVEEKYGEDKVAQIITFTTFQSKSAARESARILQFDDNALKFISSNISSTRTLKECYESSEPLRNFVNENTINRRWFSIALSLESLPKNPSVHAAGVVISDNNPLVKYAPLAESNMTKYLTQWTMDDVESVGLLKIDFLGIRYLTMVSSIVEQIKKENPEFDITKINYKD